MVSHETNQFRLCDEASLLDGSVPGVSQTGHSLSTSLWVTDSQQVVWGAAVAAGMPVLLKTIIPIGC